MGRPTWVAAVRVWSKVSAGRQSSPEAVLGPLAVADDVLRHDDARIHQDADGDGDAGQRHDVGGDAELVHQDEGDQDGGRQGQGDDQDAAEVEQKEDVHQGDEDDLLRQGLLERIDGTLDQVAAVVEGDDADTLRQPRGQAGQPCLDVLDDAVGVLAIAHDHDAADHLAPIHIQGAAAEIPADADGRDIAQIQRRAAVGHHRDGLQVGGALHQADAAHDELGAVLLDGLAADIEVGLADSVQDLTQGGAVEFEHLRGDLDLILAHEAADAGDLGHAGHGGELIADEGVLQGAQRAQVLSAGLVLEVVLVDPAQAGGVWAEACDHPLREQVAEGIQPLQDPGAGEVDVDLVLEDHRQEGEAEHGAGAYRLDPGQSLQGHRQGVGDLVLHLLGRAARPVRVDDDLVLREVRDGIDGDALEGEQAPGAEGDEAAQDQEAVVQRPMDEAVDHWTSSPHSSMAEPKKGLRSWFDRDSQRPVPRTGVMGHWKIVSPSR